MTNDTVAISCLGTEVYRGAKGNNMTLAAEKNRPMQSNRIQIFSEKITV